MTKELFLLIVCGLMSLQSFAQGTADDMQGAKQEITKDFTTFFKATGDQDVETVANYMYPRLFEFVPRELLISSMKQMMSDTTIKIQFLNTSINEISDITTIDKTDYAIVSYSFTLLMTMLGEDAEADEDSDFNPIVFTADALAAKHGKDNVTYDLEKSQVNVNIVTKAMAFHEESGKTWTFLEYKPELEPILTQLVPDEILKTLAPEMTEPKITEGEANSLEAALANPEEVTSLIINGGIHGLLESLPKEIGELKNLKILYLTDHPLRSIPKEIGQLQQLKELSFAGCQLTSVPDELFQLTNLKELLLNDNQFSEEYLETLRQRFEKEMPNTEVTLEY